MFEDYFRQYGIVGLLLVVAILIPTGMLAAGWLAGLLKIRPKRPNPVKQEMYECGMEPIGGKWMQFNFRYYVFALLFLIFDVLAVLLYPWAVQFRSLGLSSLLVVIMFLALLTVGWVYAWRKQAFEWR